MSVRIQFDQTQSQCYTNLDFISGHVVLVLPTDATISAINVKLEAESRTRLAGPKSPNNERSDKKRTELEVHKLLYKVQTVFPTPEIQQNATNSQYTLLAGQYVYPFRFKFPFNNDCTKNTSILKDLKMGAVNVQFGPDMNKHIKRALPPSLSGFPGEAEIKYYVKATVVRPKFYQENLRTQVDIKFLPIEPPRPPDRHEETFARRKQQFQKNSFGPEKKSIFKKSSSPNTTEQEPPTFQVDARLPSPAIITCNEPLPLRVLVQKLNDVEANVYLSMFQIELIGWTNVRAHDLNRTERGNWVLTSMANMNLPLNTPSEKSQREWKLPPRLWENIPLPNTVAPSFETCNISRRYQLEVRVGLAHGVGSGVRPELIVLPLLLDVRVFSGIAPPPQLLKAMASQAHHRINEPQPFERPEDQSYAEPPAAPPTPTTEMESMPAPVGHFATHHDPGIPDDAPPSYEDAMAEDLAPVDGPRREYSVPESDGGPAFNSDVKGGGGGLGRRISERLFSQNGPAGPHRRQSSLTQTSPVQEDDEAKHQSEEGPAPGLPLRSTSEKQ